MMNKKNIIIIAFILIILFQVVPVMAQPSLTISSIQVQTGDKFQLQLILDSDGEAIAALSTDILFDSSVIEITDAQIGDAADAAGKMIIKNNVSDGTYRVGILSMSNNEAIEDGIVAYIDGSINASIEDQILILSQNASGSDPQGTDISVSGISGELTVGNGNGNDLSEDIHAYLVLTDKAVPYTLPYGSSIQVYGSSGTNTINIEQGAHVQCMNFIGTNVINVKESSSEFTCYRSGATVYFHSTSGTLIEIAATQTPQTLRFADGGSELLISGASVFLGYQSINTSEFVVDAPINGSDTSEDFF